MSDSARDHRERGSFILSAVGTLYVSSRLVEGRLSYQFLNGLHQCHEKWNKTRIRMVLHVSTKDCGTASVIRDMFLYESKLLQCYAAGPILSVFFALIVHSELKSVHPGFPVAFIF